MSFEEDHKLETYKSLITIAAQALKTLQLLNGGAIVALLAYLGQVHPAMSLCMRVFIFTSLMFFIFGLALSAYAYFEAHRTQLILFNEAKNKSYQGESDKGVNRTTIVAKLSLLFFIIGALVSAMVLISA